MEVNSGRSGPPLCNSLEEITGHAHRTRGEADVALKGIARHAIDEAYEPGAARETGAAGRRPLNARRHWSEDRIDARERRAIQDCTKLP